MTMKKFLTSSVILTLSFVTLSAMASSTAAPLSGITISSNVSNVNMSCVSNTGGSGLPIVIDAIPFVSWWGGITSHFQGTNLQCTFSLQSNPQTIVGSEHILVWRTQPLSAAIDNVKSATGYALTATGSKVAGQHVHSFYNYTVTMNTASQK
ncbi:MAG: hypothetical protein COY58_07630 [Gammaproteobacteria bacterium CG_4_10_14_0_8_um_filter_38_16]|nr:MAG: hypothetical protein COY58_07630 [Gammaproteobacteria bacterium CG_4_10_14_0_8_um_filter_38_16]PJA02864.1 MAG: hypothetical protein COX72_08160 [Gammaproteobacteria bacterium CG_4_10_14_0_2_um_filter_38_22]PJB09987.1 MAG: hypothetical protein CO120_07200 [Gammaproteobacteria bacterium CG_4_9_14_3_um_filter_38_9]